MANEDSLERRDRVRQDRILDRREQKERLDELAPRAEAGTKDRALEKKRERADQNRVFALAKTDAGGVEEVPETDLLGDDDGGWRGSRNKSARWIGRRMTASYAKKRSCGRGNRSASSGFGSTKPRRRKR